MHKLNINLLWDDNGKLFAEDPTTGEVTDVMGSINKVGGWEWGHTVLLNKLMGKAVSNTYKNNKKYAPRNIDELSAIIVYIIKSTPKNETIDLNQINISNITDMTNLFSSFGPFSKNVSDEDREVIYNASDRFDISKWNVSNVRNMRGLFANNKLFNGDISNWDVSNVENMEGMFWKSIFNGDISNWDVSNVKNMRRMFCWATQFNQDLSNWDVSNVTNMENMFVKSSLEENNLIPNWYNKNIRPEFYNESNNLIRNSYINKIQEREAFSKDIRSLLND